MIGLSTLHHLVTWLRWMVQVNLKVTQLRELPKNNKHMILFDGYDSHFYINATHIIQPNHV